MNAPAGFDRDQRPALEAAWREFAADNASEPPLEQLRASFFAGAIAAIVLRNGPARAALLREVRDYVACVRAAAAGARR